MTFNRDSAFSLSLADPDFPETEQIINSAITINNELYIFSRTAIFRMLSADTLDPERNHPDTLHSYEKIYSVGSEKPIVARTILQFSEIFRFLGSSDIDEKQLLSRAGSQLRESI